MRGFRFLRGLHSAQHTKPEPNRFDCDRHHLPAYLTSATVSELILGSVCAPRSAPGAPQREDGMEAVFVAHAFYAGGQMMQAGTYTLTCDHQNREIILANAVGASVRLPVLGIVLNDVCDTTQMDFVRDGDRLVLCQIHLRDEGHVDIADVIAQPASVVNIADYRNRRTLH
jgi:hypothetical protein